MRWAETPVEELEEFPKAGFRARRWLRFERDLQAWLGTPEGQFAQWCAHGGRRREGVACSLMPTTRHASAGILADAELRQA